MNNLIDTYKVYLASNFALYLKTHGAHFNISGMFFQPLHKLFEDQYTDLWKAHDSIGEHIRTLDIFTPASLSEYTKFSLIDDIEGVMSDINYIDRLFMDHERMIILIHKLFEFAEAKKLQDHMNFLAERLDKHGKHRWMLKTITNPVK